MKKYAKFIDDDFRVLTRVPNRSVTTDSMLKEYAENNGWKEYIISNAPNRYYTMAHHETAKRITQTWEPIPMDEARTMALDSIQSWLDNSLATRAVIPCSGFDAGIIYDADALINAMGLAAGDIYIDASDNVRQITADDVDAVKGALKSYRLSLYARAAEMRAQVKAATTVDEISSVI